MALLVPVIKATEYDCLMQQGVITPSSHYIPCVHPTRGVATSPYCYDAEDYWAKPNPSLICCDAHIVKGFDAFTCERLALKDANSEKGKVEYKRFGERTGRTVNLFNKRRYIVTPPIIGVSADDTPIFVNWLENSTVDYYQGLLNYFEQMQKALFVIAVRGLTS